MTEKEVEEEKVFGTVTASSIAKKETRSQTITTRSWKKVSVKIC